MSDGPVLIAYPLMAATQIGNLSLGSHILTLYACQSFLELLQHIYYM
jgi:hypothetical protein